MKEKGNPIIAKLDIPLEILGNIEYGFYGNVDTYYDDSLYGYYIPLPEYIILAEDFKKSFIIDFSSNGVWKNPLKYEIENDFFWVEKEHIFKEFERQAWNNESIYYEYIKYLFQKLDFDINKIISYLKKIDLNEEIEKMKKNIIKEKTITKRLNVRKNK